MSDSFKKWAYKILILVYVFGPLAAVLSAIILLWNQYVFAQDIVLLLVFYFFTSLGITIGYHRMLTHQGFKTYKWIRGMFIIFGVMAMGGPPLGWAATHMKHHAHSDHDGDPHSPLEGFWHAHFGWILLGESWRAEEGYADHLKNDPVVLFIHKTTLFWTVLSLGLPYAIGGMTGLVWGTGVRIFLTNHITWGVNSICHTFGSRPFETTDESRNNWFIGLFAMGEGWHNNHHAFPRNAFHGMKWYQVDISGMVIRTLEMIGLVWDVERVEEPMVQAHKKRGATMHESIQHLKSELSDCIESATKDLKTLLETLPKKKAEQMDEMVEQTVQRFTEIQQHLENRRNMKKKAIEQRREEVVELYENAKQLLRTKKAT